MKQPKRLTRGQKAILREHRLNWKNWLLLSENGSYLRIIHKESRTIRSVCKFPQREG